MALNWNGNVGIGTTTPSYKLHVNGYSASPSTVGKYFNQFPTGTALINSTQVYQVSVYASGGFATNDVFVAWSDKRAKILEEPPSESYINLVDKIHVRQFSWIDKVEKGPTKRIGFFAQEVEEILPDAVGTTTGVVPTVYCQAEAFTETTVTVKNHGITNEKKLEVVDPENGKIKIDIVRVIDTDNLEVKFEKVPKDKLFIVGPEVDDTRVINNDYLMAVSFGGLKELHAIVKTQAQTISSLEARIAAIEAKLAA
jgi:hypothetical protein